MTGKTISEWLAPKHYEFPIPFNGLMAESAETWSSAAGVQTALKKMDARIEDFTVKVGDVVADLDPRTGFKITASSDLKYDAAPIIRDVGQTMRAFLSEATKNSAIANYIRQVLTDNGLDFDVYVNKVIFQGPQLEASLRYGNGIGVSVEGSLASATLELGLDALDTRYYLSFSGMYGENATLRLPIPGLTDRRGKVLDESVSAVTRGEFGVGPYKVGFGGSSKPIPTSVIKDNAPSNGSSPSRALGSENATKPDLGRVLNLRSFN